MNNPRVVRQEGVILRKFPYGESDEILTVLMHQGGTLKLFAPASRRSRRRFGGKLDAFARLMLEFRGGHGTLGRLQSAEEIPPENSAGVGGDLALGADMRAYAFLNYLAELLCDFIPEGHDSAGVYELWTDAYRRLARDGYSAAFAVGVLLELLGRCGYALACESCAVCECELVKMTALFSPEDGGTHCPACARLKRVAPTAPLWADCNGVLAALLSYMRFLLQKRPKAEAFLRIVAG